MKRSQHHTEMIAALRACDARRVLELADADPLFLKSNYFNGRSLLECAVRVGNLEMVRGLVIDRAYPIKKDIRDMAGHAYNTLPYKTDPRIALFLYSLEMQQIEIAGFLLETQVRPLGETWTQRALVEALLIAFPFSLGCIHTC